MPAATATAPVTARNNPLSGSTVNDSPGQRQQSRPARARTTGPAIAAIPATRPAAPASAMPTPATQGRNRSGRPAARPARPAARRPRRRRRPPPGQAHRPVSSRIAATIASGRGGHPATSASTGTTSRTAPVDAVGAREHPAVTRAVTDRDDQLGPGDGIEGAPQRHGHVPGHHPGHQQRIGMPGRGDQPRPVPLRVIHRAERRADLHLAPVTRPGVHVPDLHRAPQPSASAGPGPAGGAGSRDPSVRTDLAPQAQHSRTPVTPVGRQQQSDGRRARLRAQALQQIRLPGQHAGQYLPGHAQQLGHLRAGQ